MHYEFYLWKILFYFFIKLNEILKDKMDSYAWASKLEA